MNLQRALEVFNLENLDELDSKGLKALFKKLAKDRHPDQGGNHKDFVLLKEAHTVLERELEENTNDPSSTGLKTLSKEDILNKYYQDTRELQVQIEDLKITFDDQAETLVQIKSGTDQVIEKFTQEKEKLKKELDYSIDKLQKNYNTNLLKKILFFLPKLSEKEFWDEYNYQVSRYTRKSTELDLELYKVMLSIYGEGLNNIAKLVGKVE